MNGWLIPGLPALVCLTSAWGQGPATLEVASVKLHEFPPGMTGLQIGGPSQLKISGNRVTTFGSLPMLVMAAYNLRLHQVTAGPEWADSGGNPLVFDIQAKAEGEGVLSQEQARRLVQALLAERFHLKVRAETKEVPVYELTVDKNGSKLKETAPGTESKSTSAFSRGIWKFQYTNLSTGELTARIASNYDRPILDRTGLTGRYDVTLEYRRENINPSPSDSGPSIFTALQQVGLKVTRAKEPMEMTVIDHAERPAEN